jgi:hypothetical protein
MSTVSGGRNVYGLGLGVLLLETRFPRVPGDIGNATSYRVPVRFKVVHGAVVPRVVSADPDPALADDFIAAGRELEAEGVRAITTSCGFMVLFQETIARALSVPFFASSLLLLPLVYRLTGRPVGVITANARALSARHLAVACGGLEVPVVVAGLEDRPAFRSAILEDGPELDPERVEAEVVETAAGLVRSVPDIGALLFECHNLPPYAAAVQKATGRPVFHIFHLVDLVLGGTFPDRFSGWV